ncbi:hypothetical protein BH24CHL6_BH24CHL6_13540 [soil metagenome]
MGAVLGSLARYAHPILLLVAALLAIGAALMLLALQVLGWSLYGLGHLGLLVALPAVAAVYRASLDKVSWVALVVVYVGGVLGIPVVLMMLSHYLQNPDVDDLLMPQDLSPLGMLPGVVVWVGLALFGVAAWSARAVPRGGAATLVVGAVLAFGAEIGFFIPLMWAFGIIFASIGLVWLAPAEEDRRPATQVR